MPALTKRDAAANDLRSLLVLPAPRKDAPLTLPDPADSGLNGDCAALDLISRVIIPRSAPPPVARPDDPVNDGNIAGVLHAALRSDLALSPAARSKILAQFSALKTRGDARQYADAVRRKLLAVKGKSPAAG